MELYLPIPFHPDGRPPVVSDGWHTEKDVAALKAARVHYGVDFMYRRYARGASNLPDQSPWYECPQGVPVIAPLCGKVIFSQKVRRGGYIMLSHGEGFATQYMHLERMDAKTGERVHAGQQIGLVGFDISGYKLRHLHFQCRESFKDHKATGFRVNPTPYIKQWKALAKPLEPPK